MDAANSQTQSRVGEHIFIICFSAFPLAIHMHKEWEKGKK